jgi:membrane protein required for colicin V production
MNRYLFDKAPSRFSKSHQIFATGVSTDQKMNRLDILIIIIISYCLVTGLWRGIIRELASIVGVVIGFIAAYSFYMEVGKYLLKWNWVSDPAYCAILSFLIIFCSVFILIGVLGMVIRYLLKIATLTWLDRTAGGGAGIIKGILIASILIVLFTAFLKEGADILKGSVLAPHITLISEQMAKVVSKEMKQKYTEKVELLKKDWNVRQK